MKYLTGIHALNLVCALETCGDWHCSALRWENMNKGDTEQSIFGEYGLEYNKKFLIIIKNLLRRITFVHCLIC